MLAPTPSAGNALLTPCDDFPCWHLLAPETVVGLCLGQWQWASAGQCAGATMRC